MTTFFAVSTDEIAARVFLAIAVVVVLARLMGSLARRLGQPAVVGEIIAGILLGPTFVGALPGHLDTVLFPLDIRPYLTVVAQLGLIIFMFIVGLELDVRLVRGKERRRRCGLGRLGGAALLVGDVAGPPPVSQLQARRRQDRRLPGVRALRRRVDVGHGLPGAGAHPDRAGDASHRDRRPRARLRRGRRRRRLVAARGRRGHRRSRQLARPTADPVLLGRLRVGHVPRGATPADPAPRPVPPRRPADTRSALDRARRHAALVVPDVADRHPRAVRRLPVRRDHAEGGERGPHPRDPRTPRERQRAVAAARLLHRHGPQRRHPGDRLGGPGATRPDPARRVRRQVRRRVRRGLRRGSRLARRPQSVC